MWEENWGKWFCYILSAVFDAFKASFWSMWYLTKNDKIWESYLRKEYERENVQKLLSSLVAYILSHQSTWCWYSSLLWLCGNLWKGETLPACLVPVLKMTTQHWSNTIIHTISLPKSKNQAKATQLHNSWHFVTC